MQILESEIKLESVIPNIGQMLSDNAGKFSDKPALQQKVDGTYVAFGWNMFYDNILNIAFNLRYKFGFGHGDRMLIFSSNRIEMLELELAVMSSGGIAIPIFAHFQKATAQILIRHSDAKYIAVAGTAQLNCISEDLNLKHIYVFDKSVEKRYANQLEFSELLSARKDLSFTLSVSAHPDEVCLNMYTSGTMGTPKCVQLTHKNILSQQAALSLLWSLDSSDRFLSYLPWHHSFGGIFELFTALSTGATLSLESGYGRDPKEIMENWKIIQPTIFFSVPKVYQSLYDLTRKYPEAEHLFFHSQLKFIFTAAAALPQKLSDEFEKRNIPVIEGWGLTETSPCCTLTDPAVKRKAGVVGKPIPGVSLRLTEDGEIQVKGPNVMVGYYKNDEANQDIFTDDNWFCTGDIGEFTADGLKLITRKDRIFKLSNGEKVIPSDLEKLIELKCHYISFAIVVGSGEEYPVALLFPNKKLLENPDYSISPEEGCFCPRDFHELRKCLHGCLHDANCGIGQKFAKIKSAMIIDDELSLEKGTLTPSMKVAPKNVVNAYKGHLKNLYDSDNAIDEDVYIIRLDEMKNSMGRIYNS